MAAIHYKDFQDFRPVKGSPLPTGEWITITQKMINAFADATLDFQWIHTDIEKAKQLSPFKTTIAHGFMSVSMLSKMIEEVMVIDSVKLGVNYGLNKVRFPHPVPAGSRLRLNASVFDIEDYAENGLKITWDCKVEIEGVEKPACVGQFIALVFE